jgi:hypothetical protein
MKGSAPSTRRWLDLGVVLIGLVLAGQAAEAREHYTEDRFKGQEFTLTVGYQFF